MIISYIFEEYISINFYLYTQINLLFKKFYILMFILWNYLIDDHIFVQILDIYSSINYLAIINLISLLS